MGFALGIMKNRRVAEIEEYIPHEKMYQKDSAKGNSSNLLQDFTSFFLNMYRLLINILVVLVAIHAKRRPGFDQEKDDSTLTSAENCCS